MALEAAINPPPRLLPVSASSDSQKSSVKALSFKKDLVSAKRPHTRGSSLRAKRARAWLQSGMEETCYIIGKGDGMWTSAPGCKTSPLSAFRGSMSAVPFRSLLHAEAKPSRLVAGQTERLKYCIQRLMASRHVITVDHAFASLARALERFCRTY